MLNETIVISTEAETGLDSLISQGFGKSPFYVVAEVNGAEVVHTSIVKNNRFNGHQMGLLHPTCKCGARVLLAGGMEPRVAEMFNDMGVNVVSDLDGTARQALERYVLHREATSSRPATTASVIQNACNYG